MKTQTNKRRASKPQIEELTRYQLRRLQDHEFILEQLLKKISLETGIPLEVLEEYRNECKN